jgi:hypothetical protein
VSEPDETGPGDLPADQHRDAKLLRWVMHKVAKELRDDPTFTGPFYERMAENIIRHVFSLFARWLAFAVIGSIVGAALIWLGAQGVFFK